MLLAGCTGVASGADTAVPTPADTLAVGYYPTVTHAPAIIGVTGGHVAEALDGTILETEVFSSGPAAIEALYAGAVDAAFVGPVPTINAFVNSDGESVRVVAGATSGGSALVVRPGIDGAEDLHGATLASPQLGGTQDVALRTWLAEQGLQTSIDGGGDVAISPTENAQALQLFRSGRVDGAWLPEPWASRLVEEAGAHVLVNERDLWPDGQFVTTHLVVRTDYLRAHPQTVEALLRGHLAAIDWVQAHPGRSREMVNQEIAEMTGEPLSEPVLRRAFAGIEVTPDPLAATLPEVLENGVRAGTIRGAWFEDSDDSDHPLEGLYDLTLLNTILTEAGRPAVSAAGLGKE